jgi:uncharacterized protein
MESAAVNRLCCAWTFGVALVAAAALAAPAQAWTPDSAAYGVGQQANVAITMGDGTVLRANVYYPTDLRTGKPATGPFPVILTQTPYGKDNAVFSGLGAGESAYLVQRGYINALADVRGTGGSQGQWGLFDPVQGTDGATLVNWAAALPHSDGKVGLLGASYLGIDQFATAVDAGPSHVKAMFPIISGNDLYRDTSFAGGFQDIEFDGFYLGLTAGLNLLLPAEEGNSDVASALTAHINDLATFDAALTTNIETGGSDAFDAATGPRAARSTTSRQSSRTGSRRSWSAAGTTSSSAASYSTTRASRTRGTTGRCSLRWRLSSQSRPATS